MIDKIAKSQTIKVDIRSNQADFRFFRHMLSGNEWQYIIFKDVSLVVQSVIPLYEFTIYRATHNSHHGKNSSKC